MAKKQIITVNVTFRIRVEKSSKVKLTEIMNELDYRFEDTTHKARIADTEMTNFEEIVE